jgi:hypothetical protein
VLAGLRLAPRHGSLVYVPKRVWELPLSPASRRDYDRLSRCQVALESRGVAGWARLPNEGCRRASRQHPRSGRHLERAGARPTACDRDEQDFEMARGSGTERSLRRAALCVWRGRVSPVPDANSWQARLAESAWQAGLQRVRGQSGLQRVHGHRACKEFTANRACKEKERDRIRDRRGRAADRKSGQQQDQQSEHRLGCEREGLAAESGHWPKRPNAQGADLVPLRPVRAQLWPPAGSTELIRGPRR